MRFAAYLKMHELPITQSMLEIISNKCKEVQASKVTQISLVVGELSGAVPDCIEFYFDSLSKETVAEDAVLDIKSTTAQLRCRTCSTTFSPQNSQWACPKCQSLSIEIVGGRELYIESIEVE